MSQAKLSVAQVIEMRTARRAGENPTSIAARYGLSDHHTRAVLTGKRYSLVPGAVPARPISPSGSQVGTCPCPLGRPLYARGMCKKCYDIEWYAKRRKEHTSGERA
jgi:hypothetical protein